MKSTRAFTIIELLVVVSIIALLVGILLPAIGKARDQAKMTISQANLRNLGTAHQSYAAEWSDRQFTLVNDGIASYGANINAFDAYYQANGGEEEHHTHPGPILGWGYEGSTGAYLRFSYQTHEGNNENEEHSGSLQAANASLNLPVNFGSPMQYFGSFRLINVEQFNQYVSGKFYDKTFYAPKDSIPMDSITTGGHGGANLFEDPGAYADRPNTDQGEIPVWSSYVLSPAAMFNPAVMAHDDPASSTYNGWVNPWSLPGGYRSPAYSQALFPALKTHMLEHHWLQGRMSDCNANFSGGAYVCEPYYFNHAWESSPVTLFYDGHVENVGTRNTMRADGRMRVQSDNPNWGLWSMDTSWGDDGYFIDAGYDQAATSFHILTTDGIRGRDLIGD